jgi:hypothetical protein
MEVRMTNNRFLLILARTLDHRIGKTDEEKPELPILTVGEALISLIIRLFIVLVNFVTCGFVIANIIRHW